MPAFRPSTAPTVSREAIHEALRAWPADHNLVLPADSPSSTSTAGTSH